VTAFITFEGIDGSGKTTVAAAVHESLVKQGHDVVLTAEPTRTWRGEAVRRGIDEDTEPVTESFLFLADRAEHTERIRAWMAAGKIVLCDRYTDSTLAYQGARLEGKIAKPLDWLKSLSARVAIDPDLVLYLRIEPRLGLERIASRDRLVRFEEERFLSHVVGHYNLLAHGSPRHRVLDAARPVAAVTAEALAAITALLPS